MSRFLSSIRSVQLARLLAIVPLLIVGLFYFSHAYGAELLIRSITLSSGQASANTTYQVSFDLPASEMLGSIKIEFCSDSPLVGTTCTPPAGFDISAAVLAAQTGETGFTIDVADSNANTIVLSRSATATSTTSVSYTFDSVVNPSGGGTFYGRLQTFASTDAIGVENDHGGVALSINNPIQISTTVPPYLLFCVGVTITGFDCSTASGDYVNFGNLNKSSTSSVTTQMLTASNAGNGFVINVFGTTMVSGTNAITALPIPDVSRPGTSQFGMNLVANTTPSVGLNPQGTGNASPSPGYDNPNFYKFNSGDIVASVATSDEYKEFTSSYIVNIPNGQPVGVYVATLTYVCTASF